MDSNKVGEIIKSIRISNKLTQKEFADKYGVTYQAVSKWENGKNLPDITLLREMAKDNNLELTEILDGEFKSKTKKNKYLKVYILGIIIILIILICLIIYFINNNSFEFKTINSSCRDFEVYGSLAYDSKKSSIYISNINYCGEEKNIYKELTCNLYEKNNNTITEISSCTKKNDLTLSEYLKNIQFNIDNFSKTCKNYTKDSLYLEINAYDNDSNLKVYKIPLSLTDNCN